MKISKDAEVFREHEITDEELKKINTFTGRELSSEDVFVFTVKLCDNEVDRDDECFSQECLRELAMLFIGKTGVTDHNWSSECQVARIFETEIIEDNGRTTSFGESYAYVKARAYTLKTPGNEEFIARIEGGINKEVSVSCAVTERICSICGNPLDSESCSHIKGHDYAGRKCCGVLQGATDAYEWSFVAVPAQRKAGVMKGLEIIECTTLSEYIKKSGKSEFYSEFESLKKFADAGRRYIDGLKNDIVRLGTLTGIPDCDSLRELIKSMDENALLSFKEALENRADEILPPVTQLGAYKKEKVKPESDYMI